MTGKSPELGGSSEVPQNPVDSPSNRGSERFSWKNALTSTAIGFFTGVGAAETFIPIILHGRMSSQEIFSLVNDVANYTGLAGAALGFLNRDKFIPLLRKSLRETLGGLFR